MKKTINEFNFVMAFDEMGMGANFSRAGRYALYEYLTDLEEDCGIEYELDVIGLCCEFTECEEYQTYEDIADRTIIIANYPDLTYGTGADETRFIAQDF
jgi:hypothetical protein